MWIGSIAAPAPAFNLSAGCGTQLAGHEWGAAVTWRTHDKCKRYGRPRIGLSLNVAVVRALIQGEGGDKEGEERRGRRLIDVIRLIPSFSKNYFRSPFRRALYGGISLLGGFYVAQTISLSFGALGVNDVIAAVLCVLFTEYVTRFYHTRPRVTFPVALLNNFKMGFSYGLFIDAFKLAS